MDMTSPSPHHSLSTLASLSLSLSFSSPLLSLYCDARSWGVTGHHSGTGFQQQVCVVTAAGFQKTSGPVLPGSSCTVSHNQNIWPDCVCVCMLLYGQQSEDWFPATPSKVLFETRILVLEGLDSDPR